MLKKTQNTVTGEQQSGGGKGVSRTLILLYFLTQIKLYNGILNNASVLYYTASRDL